MIAEPPLNRHANQRKVCVELQPIRLGGDWRGRVLTRYRIGEQYGSVDEPRACSDAVASVGQWQDVLSAIVSEVTALPGCAVLKQSRGGRVFRARIDLANGTMEVVCKHRIARNRFGGFLGRFCKSSEHQSFDKGFVLLKAGINTALPLAVLERSRGGRETWLITQSIPDSVDLERVLSGLLCELESHRVRAVKRALLDEMVELYHRMGRCRLYHRDLKASNILVTDVNRVDRAPAVWLVDLDGVRQLRRSDPRAQWRAIVRLAASLAQCPTFTRTDGLRFLRSFLQSDEGSQEAWKPRWRQVAWQVSGYNRRAARRKRGKIDGFAGD